VLLAGARGAGRLVDVEVSVTLDELGRPTLWQRRRVGDRLSPGVVEAAMLVDAVAAFVDEPMVVTAKQQQVLHRRRSAAGPVVDVVGVEEAPVLAAGEAAASIARAQRASEYRRDRPCLAPVADK